MTPRVYERVRTLARRTNATVTEDSRYQLVKFAGVTAATPHEAQHEQMVESRNNIDEPLRSRPKKKS